VAEPTEVSALPLGSHLISLVAAAGMSAAAAIEDSRPALVEKGQAL